MATDTINGYLSEPTQPKAESFASKSNYYSPKSGLSDPLRLYDIDSAKYPSPGSGRLCTMKTTSLPTGYKINNTEIYARTGSATVTIKWSRSGWPTYTPSARWAAIFINKSTAKIDYFVHLSNFETAEQTTTINISCINDYIVYTAIGVDDDITPSKMSGTPDIIMEGYYWYIWGIPRALNASSECRLFPEVASPELISLDRYYAHELKDLTNGAKINLQIYGEWVGSQSLIAHFDAAPRESINRLFYSPVPINWNGTLKVVKNDEEQTEDGTFTVKVSWDQYSENYPAKITVSSPAKIRERLDRLVLASADGDINGWHFWAPYFISNILKKPTINSVTKCDISEARDPLLKKNTVTANYAGAIYNPNAVAVQAHVTIYVSYRNRYGTQYTTLKEYTFTINARSTQNFEANTTDTFTASKPQDLPYEFTKEELRAYFSADGYDKSATSTWIF